MISSLKDLSSITVFEGIIALLVVTSTIYILYYIFESVTIEAEKRRTVIADFTDQLRRVAKNNEESLYFLKDFTAAETQEMKKLKVECVTAQTRAKDIINRVDELKKKKQTVYEETETQSLENVPTATVSNKTVDMETEFAKKFPLPNLNDNGSAVVRKCILESDPKRGIELMQEINNYKSINAYNIVDNTITKKFSSGDENEVNLTVTYGEHTEIVLTFATPLNKGSQINAVIYTDINENENFCEDEDEFANKSFLQEMGQKAKKKFPFQHAIHGRTLATNHTIVCAMVKSVAFAIFSPDMVFPSVNAQVTIISNSGK